MSLRSYNYKGTLLSYAADFMYDNMVHRSMLTQRYHCTANNAFDHNIVAGGNNDVWKTESVSGMSTSKGGGGQTYAGANGKNTASCGRTSIRYGPSIGSDGQYTMDRDISNSSRRQGRSVRENVTHTRPMCTIDDEEFDIPPLFDNTLYDSSKIPDLDIDEMGGEVVVGKVYSSKIFFQVALVVYAIKSMFNLANHDEE
ncbi:unnamed protein product [Microthlaspi erraticum]|uniref:Uncharacterized protein n=1 Tax=Microthlaspi erraticum TaxID=1685480 RepID=A0A6D2KI75_9BRAS|nr:unnamed protein product [Microthlaspi erraticum]